MVSLKLSFKIMHGRVFFILFFNKKVMAAYLSIVKKKNVHFSFHNKNPKNILAYFIFFYIFVLVLQ